MKRNLLYHVWALPIDATIRGHFTVWGGGGASPQLLHWNFVYCFIRKSEDQSVYHGESNWKSNYCMINVNALNLQELEFLQMLLSDKMCTRKFLPG
jgi:hypothetical protein